MKKIYLLFTLLLTMFGATTAFAQDDLIVEISSKTGTWTAAGSPAYANEWATYEKEPEIKIKNLTGENNMCFWDNTKTNLQFYNSQSYSGTSKTYRISVSSGYTCPYSFVLYFIISLHTTGFFHNPPGEPRFMRICSDVMLKTFNMQF